MGRRPRRGGGLLHPTRQALSGDDRQRAADEPEVERCQPDRTAAERARARAHGLVQALLRQLVDGRLVWLWDLPVQEVVGAHVAPAFLPRTAVGDESDPGLGAEPEVMAALTDVGVLAQHLGIQAHAAPRTVRGQSDRGQLAAGDPDLGARLRELHQRLKPPSTASTWPVTNPARSEHRNATAAATSSAVPSRLMGVILTSSPTISSVREPEVSSVRT